MTDDPDPTAASAQALRIARSVLAKLKIENGVVCAADLIEALDELIDPEDESEPVLVLPYPSVAREVVGEVIRALRAGEREQENAVGFVPTMEI